MNNTAEKYKQAIEFYIANPDVSIMATARKYHVDRGCLRDKLHNLNIETNRRRKFFFNENWFDVIDSEAKAYFVGFLMADGCIKRNDMLTITLQRNDEDILRKLNALMESNYPIIHTTVSNNFATNALCSILRFNSIKLVQSLAKYGIVRNKTFAATFNPENLIPEQYIGAYIRGLLDGDGWVSISKNSKEIGFSGTFNICNGIANEFQKIGVRTKPIKYKTIYRIRITNTKDITAVYNLLYKNESVCLARKKDKMTKIAVSNELVK